MHLSLSPVEYRQLEGAMRVLLSPFEYEGVDDWRVAVNRSLRKLLGGDMTTFHVPRQPVPLLSEEISAAALQRYPAHLMSWHERLGMQDRMLRMGVWTRTSLWAGDIRLLYSSDYWHELLVPERAFHSMGATVELARGVQPSTIYVNRATRRARPFGKREEAIMRLLFPAVRSGLRARITMDGAVPRLGALCDSLRNAIQLSDDSGCAAHRNPALLRLLFLDPQSEKLEDAISRLSHDVMLAYRSRSRLLVDVLPELPLTRLVVTSLGEYRLSACELLDVVPEMGALVMVERVSADIVGAAAVSGARHLSQREAQVALLLAERRSNAEIAAALGVSAHTARHHTERVLAKLGVKSRRDVHAALHRDADDGIDHPTA